MRISGSGLPRNAFFTAALFGEVPRSKTRRSASLDRQMVGELLSQAARLHDDLVLLKARPFAPSESITQALRELVEIRTCLMLALGKDP